MYYLGSLNISIYVGVQFMIYNDSKGRLGVKIGGAPSGVYVDRIDWEVANVVNGSLQVTNIDQDNSCIGISL